MEEKHKLTEKLKVVEVEIHDKKIELNAIDSKLRIAYEYEDELLQRMESARKRTAEIRNDHFRKMGELSSKYEEMKKIFDVFTGNFYKHYE